jgi:16S rRNA processing protein RimM
MQLVVGRILRPHGVRGEVVVEVTTDDPGQRYELGSVLVTEPSSAGPLTIDGVRPHQGRLLVTFEGIEDRDEAEELRGVRLCVDSADVEAPDDPDEFHDFQLVGLAAVDVAGQPIGEVLRVEHNPGHEMLVLRLTDGRQALVPFVTAIVPEVDVAGGRMVLTPPEGLFDL